MRIISGLWRGKKLQSPEGKTIRPTSDKSRQALFNMLESKTPLAGKTVLDVFCGTGALGLEALSRGAEHAFFNDTDVRLTKTNIQALGAQKQTTLLQKQASKLTPADVATVDILFMDPPYAQNLVPETLKNLLPHLKADVFLAIETEKTFAADMLPFLAPTTPLKLLAQKTHGVAQILLLKT